MNVHLCNGSDNVCINFTWVDAPTHRRELDINDIAIMIKELQ